MILRHSFLVRITSHQFFSILIFILSIIYLWNERNEDRFTYNKLMTKMSEVVYSTVQKCGRKYKSETALKLHMKYECGVKP
ncbi:longitudinals lacking protein, isoforms A/B/D/L-like isoform X28 [Aphis craccivora]|uniref:Longitudinals lacking protein, isoforms A/B/D/L-like isoform X28 n=1 Tax=Aphis craccivora TaxID=307492 RepID=A0A6G0ZB77_APHCR|nr:longitudinals lacking protein, isoforms A/B/D/L-like isoform X28 [Aphis craccivora]